MILRRWLGSDGPTLSPPDFSAGDVEGFWRWFVRNADAATKLNSVSTKGGDVSPLVNALYDAVTRYADGLGILVGIDVSGTNELIISGEGVTENFPAVVKLARGAPVVTGWKFTSFKPRTSGSITGVGSIRIDPSDVLYSSSRREDELKLDIEVVLPHFVGQQEVDQRYLCYLLLDNVLGEYDVATAIGYINVRVADVDERVAGRQLDDLAAEVDALGAQESRN